MDSSNNSPHSDVPSYIQELIQAMHASQERMQVLEQNNKQVMDAILQLTKSQAQVDKTVENPQDNEEAHGGGRATNGNLPIAHGNSIENPQAHRGETSGSGSEVPNAAAEPVADTSALPTSVGTYVTREELQKLLEQKNKSLSFSEFDLKLPYPARVAAKSYPKDYASPKFKQFNGKTGDAREHVMKFVETLGVAGLDDDLKLKEFSKSLTEKAYTWYVNLMPGSVESWNQMCQMFGEKFFSTREKVTLIDLGREYQRPKEDVMNYIQRFREKVLDVQEAQDEKELVRVCIQGMFDELQLHLQNLSLPSFSALVEAARRTNNTIMGNRKRINYPHEKECVFSTSDKKSIKKSRFCHDEQNVSPPFSCSTEKVVELLNKWVNEGSIRLPSVEHQPTNEEMVSPMYCHFHRSIGHPTKECNALRKIYHGKMR